MGSVREEQRSTLRTILGRLFGAIVILAGVSFLVQWWVVDRVRDSVASQAPSNAPYIPPESAAGSSAVPPGILFFLGAFIALILAGSWWYYQASTPRNWRY